MYFRNKHHQQLSETELDFGEKGVYGNQIFRLHMAAAIDVESTTMVVKACFRGSYAKCT